MQTSKEICDVWKSKSDNGKRVSPTVPFGYIKDPADKEKWLIDIPTAEEICAMIEEIKKDPQQFRYVA